MKDLLVIMCNSTGELRGTMPLYLTQLEEAGIHYHVESIPPPDSTIAFKLRVIRKVIPEHADYEFHIFTDAFDVQFLGQKEHILKQIPRDGILLAAEKNCHPPECKALKIPDVGPWMYANGGLWAGTPESILNWCDEIEAHPLYRPDKIDQLLYNELLAEGSELARIDFKTTLFFCLYSGYPELDFASGMPINTRYCTFPSFIHANGCWSSKEMVEKYERSLL
jgi:hypothetical protein